MRSALLSVYPRSFEPRYFSSPTAWFESVWGRATAHPFGPGGRSVYLLIHNGKRPSSGSSPRAASPTVSGTSRTLRIKSDPIRSASLSYPASRSCATPKSKKMLASQKGSGRCREWWPPGVRPPLRPRSHRAKLQVSISFPSMRAMVSRP